MAARDGEVVFASSAGAADLEAGRPMNLATRFRMASMTKPVTAVAAMILVEEGVLDLDDPVARYIPAAGRATVAVDRSADTDGRIPSRPLEEPLTVRHLLTFTSGIGAKDDDSSDLGRLWATQDIYAGPGSLAERVDRILETPLYEAPGQRWRYGWSADVLARVVEVAAAKPFGAFVRERILQPLGMEQTGFLGDPVPERAGGEPAAMYTQDEGGRLVPVPRPASDAPDWTPGGSGLISTAGDYMRFALMLWNRGSYQGVRILEPGTVAEMTRPHVTSGVLDEEGIDGIGWGLGFAVVVDAEASAPMDRNGDYWWSGYYGTSFFVSPTTGVVGVVLTQNQPGPESPLPYPVYIAQGLLLP
jgi:CubicO group peptidase (beta-lactamase class C family)